MDPKHGPASSEQHVAASSQTRPRPSSLTGTLSTHSATSLAGLMGQVTSSIRIPATTPGGSKSSTTIPNTFPSERSKFLGEYHQNAGHGRYGSTESPGGSGECLFVLFVWRYWNYRCANTCQQEAVDSETNAILYSFNVMDTFLLVLTVSVIKFVRPCSW